MCHPYIENVTALSDMALKERKQASGADPTFQIVNGFSVTSFHTLWVEPHMPISLIRK